MTALGELLRNALHNAWISGYSLSLEFTKHRLPKCEHCGREKLDHKAVTLNCPMGRKHRTHGYQYFSTTSTFQPHPHRSPTDGGIPHTKGD